MHDYIGPGMPDSMHPSNRYAVSVWSRCHDAMDMDTTSVSSAWHTVQYLGLRRGAGG